MSNQSNPQDPKQPYTHTNQPIPPHMQQHNAVGNSPLNPNHPSSAAYVPPPKKPMSKEAKIGWFILGGLGAVALIASAVMPNAGDDAATKPSPVVTSVDTGPSPDPVVTPTNKPAAPKTTQPVAPKVTQPAMTKSQEQAIGSAESYLAYTAFSRKGLIQQLSSEAGEGFSKADATFAVDHIKVNWNEQAARSAKQYLSYTHFSRQGLIQQLESSAGEAFTHAQAVYGVNKAGL